MLIITAGRKPVRGLAGLLQGSPSCSRYLTCSCCRLAAPPPRPRSASPKPLHTQAYDSAHLPLPPQLPYSPDSVPYKRHVAALETALLSAKSNDSWTVFKALHPSLHRYLPLHLLRSLFDKQAESPRRAWNRCRRLWAKTCERELPAHAWTAEQLQTLLSLALEAAASQGPSVELRQILDDLWAAIDSGTGIKYLRADTRRAWLRYQASLGGRKGQMERPQLAAARQLAETGAGEDLAADLEQVALAATPDASLLDQLLWFARRGVVFSTGSFERAVDASLKDGPESLGDGGDLTAKAEAIFEALREHGRPDLALEWLAIAQRITGPQARDDRREALIAQLTDRLERYKKHLTGIEPGPTRPRAVSKLLERGIALVRRAQDVGVQVPLEVFNSMAVSVLGVEMGEAAATLLLPVAELWLDEKTTLEERYPTTAANLFRRLVWCQDSLKAAPLATLLYRRIRTQAPASRFAWTAGDRTTFSRFMLMCLRASGSPETAARLHSDWRSAGLVLHTSDCRSFLKRFAASSDSAAVDATGRLLQETVEASQNIDDSLATAVMRQAASHGDAEHIDHVYRLLRGSASADVPSLAYIALEIVCQRGDPDWALAARLVPSAAAEESAASAAAQELFFDAVTRDLHSPATDVPARYRTALSVYHALLDDGQIPTPATLGRLVLLQTMAESGEKARQTREAALAGGILIHATEGQVDPAV